LIDLRAAATNGTKIVDVLPLISIGLLSILVGLSIANFFAFNALVFSVIWIISSMIYLLPTIRDLKDNPSNLANPVSLLGVSIFIFFSVSSLISMRDSSVLMLGRRGLDFANMVFFCVTASFLSFIAGYKTVADRKRTFTSITVEPPDLYKLSLIMLGIVWFARIYAAQKGLFFKGFQSSKFADASFVLNPKWRSVLLISPQLELFAIGLLAIAYHRGKKAKGALIASVAAGSVYYLLASARIDIVKIFILLFIVSTVVTQKLPLKKVIAAMVVFFLLLYPLGQAIRIVYNQQELAFRPGNKMLVVLQAVPSAVDLLIHNFRWVLFVSPGDYYIHNRTSGYDFVATVVGKTVEDGVGLLWGRTFMVSALGLIPRLFWRDKPLSGLDGETVIREHFGMPYGDVFPGFIGELYANFGILGVMIGSFLLGILLSYLYQWASQRRESLDIKVIFYSIFMTNFWFHELTDSAAILSLGRNLLLIGVTVLVMRKRGLWIAAAFLLLIIAGPLMMQVLSGLVNAIIGVLR